jgi:hypothetical protein
MCKMMNTGIVQSKIVFGMRYIVYSHFSSKISIRVKQRKKCYIPINIMAKKRKEFPAA